MDKALRQASGALKSEGMQLEVTVKPKYLHIRIIGGTWLGRVFGERIEQGVAFTERLVDLLKGKYKPLDPEAWTISEGLEAIPKGEKEQKNFDKAERRENPKFEYRNSKQIRMIKTSM